MRRVDLVAAGGLHLAGFLPAWAPDHPHLVVGADPRDQNDERKVYFARGPDGVYVQVQLVPVDTEVPQ
jgi:hypothetical protein